VQRFSVQFSSTHLISSPLCPDSLLSTPSQSSTIHVSMQEAEFHNNAKQ